MASVPIMSNYGRWISSSHMKQRRENILFSINPNTTSSRAPLIRASSSPQPPGADGDKASPFVAWEDLNYLAKLGVGSFAGAAAIKYGSILFPRITQPNLTQAVLMITAPVVVAIWLLIKQSSRVD